MESLQPSHISEDFYTLNKAHNADWAQRYLCLIHLQESATKTQACPEILQKSVRTAFLGRFKDYSS